MISKHYNYFFITFYLLLSTLLGCATTAPEHTSIVAPPPLAKEILELRFPDFVALQVSSGDTFSSLASKYYQDSEKGWMISGFNNKTDLVQGDEIIIPLQDFYTPPISEEGYQVVPILCYHKISEDQEDKMTIPKAKFLEQMQYLQDNGYTVISLSRFFKYIRKETSIPPKAVVLTFDDGWKSTYEIAFPIIKKFGYPLTLFVYTDMITGSSKTLSWEEIREMSDSGVEIQNHTQIHSNLAKDMTRETFEEYFKRVIKELTRSAYIIERKIGVKVSSLAYPYGQTNSLVVSVLRKLGYEGAVTSKRGSNPFFANKFQVNRAMIYGEYDLNDFIDNLSTEQPLQ